jgi:hypothetical protein
MDFTFRDSILGCFETKMNFALKPDFKAMMVTIKPIGKVESNKFYGALRATDC